LKGNGKTNHMTATNEVFFVTRYIAMQKYLEIAYFIKVSVEDSTMTDNKNKKVLML